MWQWRSKSRIEIFSCWSRRLISLEQQMFTAPTTWLSLYSRKLRQSMIFTCNYKNRLNSATIQNPTIPHTNLPRMLPQRSHKLDRTQVMDSTKPGRHPVDCSFLPSSTSFVQPLSTSFETTYPQKDTLHGKKQKQKPRQPFPSKGFSIRHHLHPIRSQSQSASSFQLTTVHCQQGRPKESQQQRA